MTACQGGGTSLKICEDHSVGADPNSSAILYGVAASLRSGSFVARRPMGNPPRRPFHQIEDPTPPIACVQ